MKTLAVASAAFAIGAMADNMQPARVEARATSSGTGSSTLPTVTTQGKAFMAGNNRFYVRGIDYQPGGSSDPIDPLADYSICSRDIPYFKELGVNTVRVYTIDNSANHDQCMSALAEAGIYLALDVNTPMYSLNRDSPGESYNPTYLQSVFATIDEFVGYSNTLLFFSGNEVINAINTTNAAPYIKAVTRDMKQYIGERGYRAVPVGYSAADVSENQYLLAQYLDCGENQTIGDFYSINNYEWCDPSSYTQSGWDQLVKQYANYSLPVFMSEYGCTTNGRTFQETTALYQTDMTSVFSGGMMYEYSVEPGNPSYGIVTISGNTVTPVGSQFSDFQSALANGTDPSGNGGLLSGGITQQCPPEGEYWNTSPFTGSALPAIPSGALTYFKNGAGTGPGLNGSGSQEAGGGSTATAASGAGSVTATYSSGSSPTGSKSAAVAAVQGPLYTAHFAMALITSVAFGLGVALV